MRRLFNQLDSKLKPSAAWSCTITELKAMCWFVLFLVLIAPVIFFPFNWLLRLTWRGVEKS